METSISLGESETLLLPTFRLSNAEAILYFQAFSQVISIVEVSRQGYLSRLDHALRSLSLREGKEVSQRAQFIPGYLWYWLTSIKRKNIFRSIRPWVREVVGLTTVVETKRR